MTTQVVAHARACALVRARERTDGEPTLLVEAVWARPMRAFNRRQRGLDPRETGYIFAARLPAAVA